MDLFTFKQEMRINRGRLASMDEEMEDIFSFGSANFIEYSIVDKHIGVAKMATIVNYLSCDKQDELVIWIRSNHADVKAIDLKLREMRGV